MGEICGLHLLWVCLKAYCLSLCSLFMCIGETSMVLSVTGKLITYRKTHLWNTVALRSLLPPPPRNICDLTILEIFQETINKYWNMKKSVTYLALNMTETGIVTIVFQPSLQKHFRRPSWKFTLGHIEPLHPPHLYPLYTYI